MSRTTLLAALAACILATVGVTSASAAQSRGNHIRVPFDAVGGSGVSGFVNLQQLPRERGTRITVVAFGLQRGQQYVSLYYDNHTCDLEPYSAEDVIGGTYTANGGGVGTTHGTADDDLDEINSVSVHKASGFTLIACADVHAAG